MKQLDDFLTKHFNKIFWILAVVFLVLYLMLIGGDYIWVDESYSFAMVKHSFSEIWRITGADVHPPLYYWYLKILIAPFNYSLIMAKVASILPYMFIIIFGGKQLRKYFNERTAILFMGLFFCFPFAMNYSIEVRMYSLASAVVFACAVFAYKLFVEHGKISNIVGLVVSGVLSAYTHYFAFLSICIIYGLLLIAILLKKRNLLSKWMVSVVASIILYAPWMSSFISQLVYKVNNEYWISKITLGTLYGYWQNLFGASGIATYALFFSLAYLICFICVLASRDMNDIMTCLCCLLVPIGTLLMGVVVSIIIRPIFVLRYLMPSVPLLITFMAIVLGNVNNKFLISSILTIVLMGGISNYGITLYSEYKTHNYVPIEEYGDVDAYVIDNVHIAGTLGYYDTEKSIYYGNSVSGANPYPNRKKLSDFYADNVDKAIILLYDDTIPDEYYNSYDIEYLGQWKCEYDVDAYLMTKK
jgi:uncharacterized membrane protein